MSTESRPVPKKLADFEIIRRLGAGGMAEVFLAKKRGAEGTHKLLVVKRVLPSHGSSQRFRTMFGEEAQLATRLNHPNIVQVYDFQDYGEEGQLLSMEYVDGPDLRKLHRAAKRTGGKIPPYLVAHVVSETAKGLHYAHERKDEGGQPLEIVHRDVSPQNILLSRDGSVKVADFGIATANVFRQEKGVLKGKTAYMSPQQALGEQVDRRTDIYSLGVVLHELLTGRPLHGTAEGRELLEAVRSGSVEPPSLYVRGVPPELEAVVMRALSMDPEKRFQTAREFSTAITRVLFQKQQLVDSHVLEGVINQFTAREHTSPGEEPSQEPAPESSNLELPPAVSTGGVSESNTGDLSNFYRSAPYRGRAAREVRHVALVRLRIGGAEELALHIGQAQTSRLSEQLHSTLNDIAYKRGSRWTWEAPGVLAEDESSGAQAVVGLMANPSRAAADAARLAMDIHEALHGICDGLPSELRARVSIVRGIAEGRRDNAGHLTHYTLQAPARAIGQALGREVAWGATWVAGGVYRLVRRGFMWNDLPSLDLTQIQAHDLPSAMRVYALLRPLTLEEKRRQLSLAPRDLVGRDSELAELHAAYHQCLTNQREPQDTRVPARLVIGEMGIGKSALVTTFLSELPPDAKKLRVECSPYRSELPFSGVGQWLREMTGIQLDEPVSRARAALVDVIGPIHEHRHSEEMLQRMCELATGRVAEAADEADAALHRRLLATGVRILFARAAQQAPLVIMLDGLQWIDLPSFELLVALMRRGESLPILVVLVSRPEERVHHLLEGIVSIELRGLSTENQISLVEAHVGAGEGVATACADLIPRAAGNPFFLLEMVDALLERGNLGLQEDETGQVTLRRSNRDDDDDNSLPSTLEQLIADRLNELPPEEHIVVDWLSVSGGPLSYDDLCGLIEGEVDEAIARLCARGLCDTRMETVDVRHPLSRDVAYRALSDDDRRIMHQRLGELLATSAVGKGLGAAIVGRHLAQGTNPGSAADYYLDAANVARMSFQLQLAARYYQRALQVLPEMDERCLEPYSVLEDICRVQGRWKERRRHLESFRACAKRSRKGYWIATVLIRHAQFDFDSGQLTQGLSLAQLGEEAAEQAQSPTQQVQAQALMAEMLRDLGEMQGALAACDRALKTVHTYGVAPRLHAEVLRAQATLLLRVGRVSEALAAHADAIAVFRHTGARRQEARARSSLAYAVFVAGQFEDAIALALEAIRIDLSIGGRFQIAKTLSNIGQSYARLGDYERAKTYYKQAKEAHHRYIDQDSYIDTLLCSAELHLELGELDVAKELVGEAERLSEGTQSTYDSVHGRLVQAAIAREEGNSSAMVMHAFDARQVAETQAYVAYHFHAMALEAVARVEIGEQHTAILLSTTTLGAIEAVQGSEYGLETRCLCLEVLERTHSPQLDEMRMKVLRFLSTLQQQIKNPALRESFSRRPLVANLTTAGFAHVRGT